MNVSRHHQMPSWLIFIDKNNKAYCQYEICRKNTNVNFKRISLNIVKSYHNVQGCFAYFFPLDLKALTYHYESCSELACRCIAFGTSEALQKYFVFAFDLVLYNARLYKRYNQPSFKQYVAGKDVSKFTEFEAHKRLPTSCTNTLQFLTIR